MKKHFYLEVFIKVEQFIFTGKICGDFVLFSSTQKHVYKQLKLKQSIIFLYVVSNNAMAGRQGSSQVTGLVYWMLAAILMLWSHQISGQGQGK